MPSLATLAPLLAVNFLDPHDLIRTFGTIGVLAIVFAETGLLIGFFLPGDSLLFTAGLLCATSSVGVHLDLPVVLPGVIVAAILGAQTGYLIGRRAGPALFRRRDSRLFRHEYVERAEHFFERGGLRAVVLARFVPIVRTFLNPAAGVAGMAADRFLLANAIGGVLWAGGVTLAGYLLGNSIPNVDHYLLPIIAVIIVLSLVPVGLELLKNRRQHATAVAAAAEPSAEPVDR
ncbi:MAG TPA: VTT domain-containing protein [Acidimicrobiales bacterium]|nr:VTT domain-containing protein [Acidimicrobiales bacterium]